MRKDPIVESDMEFGPYPEGRCFHIEKSMSYQRIKKKNVKMAEFLLGQVGKGGTPVVWIIEAKSSTPHPATYPNFDKFIEETRQKMVNALSLCTAIRLNRHGTIPSDVPPPFTALDLSATDFRFVLVIKNHPEHWLAPLNEALAKVLRPTVVTWGISSPAVVVLNEKGARKHGLILAEPEEPPLMSGPGTGSDLP